MSTRLPLRRLTTMCQTPSYEVWGWRVSLTTWWVRSTRQGLLLPPHPVPGVHDRPGHGRDCSDWVWKDLRISALASCTATASPTWRGEMNHCSSAGSYQVCWARLELMFIHVRLLIRMKPKSILILIMSLEPESFIFVDFWHCALFHHRNFARFQQI